MVVLAVAISLLAGGCASAAPGPTGASPVPAGTPAPGGSTAGSPSGAPTGTGLSSFAPLPAAEDATYLAAAEAELASRHQLRADALVAQAMGPQGPAVLAATDDLEIAFGEQAMADFVAKSGLDLTAATRTGGRVAAAGPLPPRPQVDAYEWSGSLFGATSFMVSTWMGFAPELLRDAGRDQFVQQTQNKTETHDSTIDGLREHLVLTQKLTVGSGQGRLVFDVLMTSAAVLSKPTGEEVARRTSTGNGHFEVNACPDANGVGEGRYRIINQEMVTRLGGLTNGGASTTQATFRLINGNDARLIRTEVDAAVSSGVHGTTVPTDGGAGQPIDWNAQATYTVVIPASGPATIAGVRNQSSNNATESNVGALTTQLVMADYYLAEAAKKAEAFWRSGECINVKTSEESREVTPNEALTVTVEPEGKFDKQPVKAPVTTAFTGKARLEPTTAQDPPASLRFTAGSEERDKGTIELKQTGKRGIGKKTVEFTVGIPDYKLGNTTGAQGSLSTVKCRGKDGPWSIAMTAPDTTGTITFTIPRGGTSAEAHMVYDLATGDSTAHWDVRGPVSFVAGDPATLQFGTMHGKVTVRALGESITVDNKTVPFKVNLIPGKFCT